MNGAIYLIRPREFVRIKELTYKVGRSGNVNRRQQAYPNDSLIMYTRSVNDNKKLETLILDQFKIKFTQEKKYGTEYFNGDYLKMIDVINEIIDEYDDVIDPDINIIENREEDHENLKYIINQLIDSINYKEIIIQKYLQIDSKTFDHHDLGYVNKSIIEQIENISTKTAGAKPPVQSVQEIQENIQFRQEFLASCALDELNRRKNKPRFPENFLKVGSNNKINI